MDRLTKAVEDFEKLFLKLESGEFRLEEEEYRYIEEELRDIDTLLVKHPYLKEQLVEVRNSLLLHLDTIKKLLCVVDYKMLETKKEMTDNEYVPVELKQILKSIYEGSSEEFRTLADIAMSIEDVEEKICSMTALADEPDFRKLIRITEIIKKNLHILLGRIREEKKYLYDFELGMEE